MKRPNIDVILMPTMACNLRCDYCYVLDKRPGLMNQTLLERTLDQIFRHNDPRFPTNIYWHGAEPLLAGIDFYRKACHLIHDRYGEHQVRHHIQTNGTLLNDEWFDLFIQEHITTGVSLDGPRELHDTYRKTCDGQGSFDKVFGNIMAARKKRLYLDALVVVTQQSLNHEDEIFDFFYEHRISFGFEPLIPENDWMWRELTITPEEYAHFTIRLFDRWFFQPERRLDFVMPPYHFAYSMLAGENSYCKFAECCAQNYIAVTPEGDVYSCIMFAGHRQSCLGNIGKQPLEEILSDPIRQEFLRNRTKMSNCANCQWVSLCNAGCPYQGFIATGKLGTRDMYCRSYQTIFKHVLQTINERIQSPWAMSSNPQIRKERR